MPETTPPRLAGAAKHGRSRRIGVPVAPGLTRLAAERLGFADLSDVVHTSLSVAGAPDHFKAWWAEPSATLPDDFEPAV